MPFKSQAQRRNAKIESGEMPEAALRRWEDETPKGKPFPEHVKKARDLIEGGLADNKPRSKYKSDQLAQGTKVEKEHTDDPRKAREIAADHLEEFPEYYTALESMEKRLEAEEPASKVAAWFHGKYTALDALNRVPKGRKAA